MFKNTINMKHIQNFIDGSIELDNYEFEICSPNGNNYLYSFTISRKDIEIIKELINNIK